MSANCRNKNIGPQHEAQSTVHLARSARLPRNLAHLLGGGEPALASSIPGNRFIVFGVSNRPKGRNAID